MATARKTESNQPSKDKNKVLTLLGKWTNSDGVEDEEISSKVTCTPNCDSNIGGPPLVTVAFALFLVIFHYSYEGVRELVNDRKAFVATLEEIKPECTIPQLYEATTETMLL